MEQKNLRILLTSDMHCTDLLDWYGVRDEDRLQAWVDGVLTEHARQPFDLILIPGDISLDYHDCKTPWDKGHSTGKIFMEKYLSQLPKEVPVRIIAGNHEQFPNEDWKALTGYDRENYAVVGKHLFLMLDSFNARLAHDYDSKDVYTPMNMDFIRSLMAQYPAHDVWLVSHFFHMAKESEEFRRLVAENDRVRGLFMGHTHRCGVIPLGEEYKNKTIAQTGNFSYTTGDIHTTFWGFRDLLITPEKAVSRYLQTENDVVIDEELVHIEPRISDVVEY